MGDYSLHGLNPRDFQHLVQGIARRRIAAGVIAFGDGKDGGRGSYFQRQDGLPLCCRTMEWLSGAGLQILSAAHR